ncbi:class I SAM-dependent methyltransferase [Pseudomarimonas arenosa]|uniref:Class I SAM-dependent methyltransferase n=1 Tax=Pseudomarimonas arenosa TaxID=2774145 RepID=A0AAW3ZRG3_9GAMM|nr:class I SAM-dependent methyltransferase [Pseudomarimonas arenosa]MBD8527137.1 class I SAM-dependent methyltransferase [Pseudomarimonas arenosa]
MLDSRIRDFAEDSVLPLNTPDVDRSLPERFAAGYRLTEADVQELKQLLAGRDQAQRASRPATGHLSLSERLRYWLSLVSRIAGHAARDGSYWLRDRTRSGKAGRPSVRVAFNATITAIPNHRRKQIGDVLRRFGYQSSAPTARQPARAAVKDEDTSTYAKRIKREQEIFKDQVNVHDLPEIFHYWSNKYILPMEQAFGFSHPEDFFAKFLLKAAQRSGMEHARFVSVGAGNCDAEVRIAADLLKRGLRRFRLECIDINQTMLERGQQLASDQGVSEYLEFTCCDFNAWSPHAQYAAVMANQSLHHVLDLETLFGRIQAGLIPQGLFLTSDMIGRNGHQLWPEARQILDEYWQRLPDSHRYNLQLQRMEERFLDWDCSSECFEGIRAQDILPLLLERFGFELFLGFGNLIDPFVGRSFGHHFAPDLEWNRAFIDEVHARDEAELAAGTIKPTHMIAVMTLDRSVQGRFRGNLSPQFCVRQPS